MHLSLYSRTNNDLGGLDFGGLNASAVTGLYARFSNNAYAYINGGSGVLTGNTNSTGFYVGTRTASNVLKLFKSGTQLGSTYKGANGARLDLNAFLGALNVSGTAQYYTQRNYAFASIGDGLTDAEALNFYTAVQAFQTTLGRSIGTQTVSDADAQAFVTNAGIVDQVEANAKAALEEAFTPHLKELLAAKLEAMDNKDEDVKEAMKSKKEEDMMEEYGVNEKKDEIEEEFDLNEILAELEEGEDKEEMYEAEDEEEMEAEMGDMEAEAGEDMGDEEIDLEDMTEDDLKSFIEDVIADMVAAGELEAGEEMEAEMGDMEAEEEMGDMEELEEMDDVSWEMKNNPAKGATMKNLAPTKVGQTTVNEVEDVEEVTGASGGYDPSSAAGAGLENIINSITALIKKGGPAAKKAYAVLQQLGAGAAAGMREGEEEMDEMEELKKELQEVNLLNAKLLYTNKIFKEKTLNESQKIKVLKAFDKAGSVKEAKLIFETLNEGMVSKTVKSSIMNEIKSSASKPTGVIRENRQPIVEVDPMVARWQKLAGIK